MRARHASSYERRRMPASDKRLAVEIRVRAPEIRRGRAALAGAAHAVPQGQHELVVGSDLVLDRGAQLQQFLRLCASSTANVPVSRAHPTTVRRRNGPCKTGQRASATAPSTGARACPTERTRRPITPRLDSARSDFAPAACKRTCSGWRGRSGSRAHASRSRLAPPAPRPTPWPLAPLHPPRHRAVLRNRAGRRLAGWARSYTWPSLPAHRAGPARSSLPSWSRPRCRTAGSGHGGS